MFLSPAPLFHSLFALLYPVQICNRGQGLCQCPGSKGMEGPVHRHHPWLEDQKTTTSKGRTPSQVMEHCSTLITSQSAKQKQRLSNDIGINNWRRPTDWISQAPRPGKDWVRFSYCRQRRRSTSAGTTRAINSPLRWIQSMHKMRTKRSNNYLTNTNRRTRFSVKLASEKQIQRLTRFKHPRIRKKETGTRIPGN